MNTLVLVSASDISAASRPFYQRMKGELEQVLIALNFPHLIILRPPLLIRPNSNRLGGKVTKRILYGLNRIGLLKNQRPLAAETLAKAMLKVALRPPEHLVQVYESQNIFRFSDG